MQKSTTIELKAFKPNEGLSTDSLAFSASVFVNNKKAGTVSDDGNGGCTWVVWSNSDLEKVAVEFIKSMGEVSIGYDMTTEVNEDFFFAMLAGKMETRRGEKRLCARQTCFRLEGDEEGVYRTFKHKYDDRLKAHLAKTYGDKVIEVLNDTIKTPVFGNQEMFTEAHV